MGKMAFISTAFRNRKGEFLKVEILVDNYSAYIGVLGKERTLKYHQSIRVSKDIVKDANRLISMVRSSYGVETLPYMLEEHVECFMPAEQYPDWLS